MKVKAVFFDCDGVLIFGGPWVKLHTRMGISQKQDLEWFTQYYSGEISYEEWVNNIQGRYKKNNLDKRIFQEVMDLKNYTFNKEANKLIQYLKKKNIEIAIVSSGIEDYVKNVAKYFGIKHWKSNAKFVFNIDGKFERFEYGVDDDLQKVLDIEKLCSKLDISPNEAIFIGDSDNDLKAFERTGRGILYKNDLPELQDKAWKKVNNLEEVIDIIKKENEEKFL